MIKRYITSIILITLFSVFTLPVFAEDNLPVGKMYNVSPADAQNWVKGLCPSKQRSLLCKNKIVLMTYSDVRKDKSFAQAGLSAAKRLYSEGLPIYYVVASDDDGDPQTAIMLPYVNGEAYPEYGTELSTKYGVISEGNIRRLNTENEIYTRGKQLFREKFGNKASTQ